MDSSEALKEFQLHIGQLKEENEEIKKDLLSESLCSKSPQLHSENSIDVLLRNKLVLESEIESVLNADLKFLPDNQDVLLNLAKEEATNSMLQTSEALAYQQEYNSNLKKEIKKYKELITNAEEVEANLIKLIESRNEMDYVALMKQKYSKYGILFQELREELNWYLNSRFPPPENDATSMESILESLTKKFLSDPNSPYIEFDDAKKEYLMFLVKANIISRHPKDFSKYKLNDFRRN